VKLGTNRMSSLSTTQPGHVSLRDNVILFSENGHEQWRGTLGAFIEDNSAELSINECVRIGDELRAFRCVTLNLGAGGTFSLRLEGGVA
jgi:hypothetical protein